ncbi:NAD(P)-binding domain-containing protein [Halioxenophilus sp. WMMB6]|uniref:NAD(P)-binding domain-containing protein n=1 Tax=Halioxenophilus sp. WMMB6 TaxID=3073815 RepID=UPI00295E88EF|nr:NAD(P)-binding domain-containing protein [Halioxenophilus sp. WMMB6]
MNSYIVMLAAVLLLVMGAMVWRQWHGNRRALARMAEAEQSGLLEPASLHPLIDPNRCLGCGSCVSACPEGHVLGLINRRAQLVTPSACIGHGACQKACPTEAITLVFGTASRGVEIPAVSSDFESSVPGLFIAGELGGMGLIRNAISQGQQAATAAAAMARKRQGGDFDLIIVGAGPAGLSAALAAKQKKLRYLVLEQDSIGGTIAHYPRGKVVMTAPATLPGVGKFQFKEASKEALMAYWQQVAQEQQLAVKTEQRVANIEHDAEGFTIHTERQQFRARTVLLAMGRRGTPRKLGVAGEELGKVIYRLQEPEQYRGRRVLVVGGGDSALEAALAIAEQPGSRVTLSYRGDAFGRAKQKNRERVAEFAADGRLQLLLSSEVQNITADSVELSTVAGRQRLGNDDIIVCAGGILPTPFLKKIGIHVQEKFGTA